MKYGRLVVFIRHDSAEIWGFRYGLTLVIGTQKVMASTGVFVRVVFALKHFIKNCICSTSMLLVFSKCKKKSQHSILDLDIENPLGRGTLI
jgi:hypothetical protein